MGNVTGFIEYQREVATRRPVEERVNEVLPTLYDMVQDGLIEVQDTTVVKDVM